MPKSESHHNKGKRLKMVGDMDAKTIELNNNKKKIKIKINNNPTRALTR